jgi:hypothetical protein
VKEEFGGFKHFYQFYFNTKGNVMKSCFNVIAFLTVCLIATGCSRQTRIVPVTTLTPINVSSAGEHKSIELGKVISDVNAGTTIGYYDWNYFGNPINFMSSDASLFRENLKKCFDREAISAGYKIVSVSEELFAQAQRNVDFAVGARILDVKQNRYTAAFGRLRTVQSVKVKWQVYSNNSKGIVGDFTTEGYHEGVLRANSPTISIIDEALTNSVKNLLAIKEFADISNH